MYQNLSLCRKHGSYTCRATLRNFVGNIPALLSFVRKIPTHDIMCRNNSYKCRNYTIGTIPTLVRMIPTLVGIIPTLQEDVLHFVPSVGIFLTKFNSVGIFPTKFWQNSQ